MDTLELIKKYGLTIRQIPKEKVHYISYNSDKSGEYPTEEREIATNVSEETFQHVLKGGVWDAHVFRRNKKGTIFKKCLKITKIPHHAGYWMTKQINHTDTLVGWNKQADNLAPTLEKSVEMCIKKLNNT